MLTDAHGRWPERPPRRVVKRHVSATSRPQPAPSALPGASQAVILPIASARIQGLSRPAEYVRCLLLTIRTLSTTKLESRPDGPVRYSVAPRREIDLLSQDGASNPRDPRRTVED